MQFRNVIRILPTFCKSHHGMTSTAAGNSQQTLYQSSNSRVIDQVFTTPKRYSHIPIEDFLDIKISTKDNETHVEVVPVPTGRENMVIQVKSDSGACSLCRLNLHNLNYTDVMILGQFIKRDGSLATFEESKLCTKQYLKIKQLIRQAQRCNLIQRPADYLVPGRWHDLNTYIERDRQRDQPMKDCWATVRPGPTGASTAAANSTSQANTNGPVAATNSGSSASDDNNSYLGKYSVQALNALAEYVAPVLDVVYASDEKEKVVNLINGIMYYVNPYLKNHLKDNMPSFLACSHLLSSISGYQYTRKAWRKDTLELLLDPQFFQMDSQCMVHWRVIVDHLMTHDKTTFRDFLAKMSPSQSALQGGPLKLFASRDQESEQRAQLIKRMAFILFCSERDQYHKYTPDIQEKLIESLRDGPSDMVQSQIMLCFRVLIIRSSAHLLTSLWPFVYTEMVQGLLDIEAYLETSIATALASSADQAQIQANLQVTPGTAERFQLFLYTCKLLDMVLALPADSLPQFQMYRWSFIGAGDDFEPHLVRIERRLTELSACPTILPYRSHYPILTLNKISNILDLHPFFKTLVKVNRCEYEQQAVPPTTAMAYPQSDANHNHQFLTSTSTLTSPSSLAVAAARPPLNPYAYDDPNKFIDAILEYDFLV